MALRKKRIFEFHFGVEAEKDAFIRRLSSIRTLLSAVATTAWLALTTSVLCQPRLTLWKVLFSHGGKRAPNYPVLHDEE